eukprot:TRINITY_DN3486_c0_g1_i7.p1 TRINITY_DN3486_c0_g1~~TRINITY_DN3486_c0_g1_i7.p1  ORF type:complete len:132 (+),score=32.42 TRINITY_DN3486_c0_g1_i7:103-498(+)
MGKVHFGAFDMGGHPAVRHMWTRHILDIDGILFLVDSSDADRLQEARQALSDILLCESMQDVPVVVMANKIDLPTAIDEESLRQQLGLEGTTTGKAGRPVEGVRPIEVFMCSVTKKFGIIDSFNWLSSYLK